MKNLKIKGEYTKNKCGDIVAKPPKIHQKIPGGVPLNASEEVFTVYKNLLVYAISDAGYKVGLNVITLCSTFP